MSNSLPPGVPEAGLPRIVGAGIGLRDRHLDQVLSERPPIPWLELLADNYLAEGGLDPRHVESLRADYPMTLHCVGMNLGGTDPIDPDYLRRVRALRERAQAAWVSDHLCFTAVDGRHYHDLLPFPYTDEALRYLRERVLLVQDLLGAPLVIENVSAYLRFRDSRLSEAQFLHALAAETGCLMLLDLNNLYVNQVNLDEDLDAWLMAYPMDRVREIHLAGYETRPDCLIDAHNNRVSEPVWRLLARVAPALPEVPVLIEWDNDVPPLEVLLAEAATAAGVIANALTVGASVEVAS